MITDFGAWIIFSYLRRTEGKLDLKFMVILK